MPNGDSGEQEPLANRKHASTCRWAVSTVTLDTPEWLEAENAPWTCMRETEPHVLDTTERCEACPNWEPRAAAAETEVVRQPSDGQQQGASAVPAADWFAAGPSPHETK